MNSVLKMGIGACSPNLHLVTKSPNFPSFAIVGSAKSWIPLLAASLDLSPLAELVLLPGLESKCLFHAKMVELGLQLLEKALSCLGQVDYKNRCALLPCASSPG